jgi:hypothetical protein
VIIRIEYTPLAYFATGYFLNITSLYKNPPEALLRLEQPLKPALPIARKLEKEFLLMATMGYMPDLSRDMMTVGSRHLVFP